METMSMRTMEDLQRFLRESNLSMRVHACDDHYHACIFEKSELLLLRW